MARYNASRQVLICADDVTLDHHTTEAALDLLGKQRLSAVSCRVTRCGWPQTATALKQLDTPFACGLQLVITADTDAKPVSLYRLMQQRLCNKQFAQSIRQCIHRQLTLFEQHWGAPPAHICSHLELHQLPFIADILMTQLKTRYPFNVPRVRTTAPIIAVSDRRLRNWSFGMLGNRFLRYLNKHHMTCKTNTAFAGIYSQRPHIGFERLVSAWLQQLPSGGELICHPSLSINDSRFGTGVCEYLYLKSDLFTNLLDIMEINITSHRPIPPIQ